jgi:hypothetical protein
VPLLTISEVLPNETRNEKKKIKIMSVREEQEKLITLPEKIYDAVQGSIYKNESGWSIQTLPKQSNEDALNQEVLQEAMLAFTV